MDCRDHKGFDDMKLTITAPSILISTQAVDFRKSIDGLVDIVITKHCLDPREHIFVFYNRARDKIKILAWHKNGFVLLLKRINYKLSTRMLCKRMRPK